MLYINTSTYVVKNALLEFPLNLATNIITFHNAINTKSISNLCQFICGNFEFEHL